MLKIGDKMPSFEVLDQDGNAVRSDSGGIALLDYIYRYDKKYIQILN